MSCRIRSDVSAWGIGRGNFRLIAQSVAVTRYSRAPVGMRRAPARSNRGPAAALTTAFCQHGVLGLKLAAGALAAATAALAIINNQDGFQSTTAAFEPARNETVVYRQAAVRPGYQQLEQADEADAAEDHEDQAAPVAAPSYYTRVVQTIRFLNPNRLVMRDAGPQGTIKVGGFIAFPGRGAPEADDTQKSRRRGPSIMDEVDDYLWEVYQRVPVKKDGAGDFTWKDPAAAKRVGMTLQDYVIVGMDPEFREQLYHAGKAMDAAGVQWSLLSAFRDDYRQGIATGFKARGGNSLHGGSRRTGGYGHGRAVDVTGVDSMSEVWNWIDAHGAKYGLYRPMPGNDPAHVQQRGDWHKIALSLRESRTRVADAAAVRGKEAGKHKVIANATR